jgi:monoamine oxidase
MSHSLLFRKLTHLMRSAQYCHQHHIPTPQWLEQYSEVLEQHRERQTTPKALIPTEFQRKQKRQIPQPNRPSSSLKVAIVGAGLAGLSCGYELQQYGILAHIYEANHRVGGRCHSLRNCFPNQIVESGGEFIDSRHQTMLHYASLFHLKVAPVTTQPGETAYYFDGQHYSDSAILDEFRELLHIMQADCQTLSNAPSADFHRETDVLMDQICLLEYLETRQAGNLVTTFIDSSYRVEYGLDLQEQSSLNLLLLHRTHPLSNPDLLQPFSDEHYQIIGGNDQIAHHLHQALHDQIQLETQLSSLRRNASHGIELTLEKDAQTLNKEYDIVILAIPFSLLRDIELDESLDLPPWKIRAIRQLGYGTVSKQMLSFQARPWIQLDSNGHSYSNLANHRVSWQMQSTPDSTVMANCLGGKSDAALHPHQFQREADCFLKDLNQIYPGAIAAASRNINNELMAHLEHWPSNSFSKGSYACYKPGQFTSIAGNEGKPIDNLYFIGEHTNSFYEWQGFMEGAALSGRRAAQYIIRRYRLN